MKINVTESVLKKLKKFKREDILFSEHAGIRAAQREIKYEDVLGRLSNPVDLAYAEPDGNLGRGDRFKCYFDVNKRISHLYVIAISEEGVEVITVVKLDKGKQKRMAKHSKIPPRY